MKHLSLDEDAEAYICPHISIRGLKMRKQDSIRQYFITIRCMMCDKNYKYLFHEVVIGT